MKKAEKAVPKPADPAIERSWKRKFQNKPSPLPTASVAVFIVGLPFNWKNKVTKNTLNIRRVRVDWKFMKRKEAMRHRAMTVKKKLTAKLSKSLIFRLSPSTKTAFARTC